jgi:hypothetical protein
MKRCLQCELSTKMSRSVCDMRRQRAVPRADSLTSAAARRHQPASRHVLTQTSASKLRSSGLCRNYPGGVAFHRLLRDHTHSAEGLMPTGDCQHDSSASSTDLNPEPSPVTVATESDSRNKLPTRCAGHQPEPSARLNSGPVVVASSPEHDRGTVCYSTHQRSHQSGPMTHGKSVNGIWYRPEGLVHDFSNAVS